MRKSFPVKHEFVKLLPTKLEERTVYISIEYSTAAHLCMCGCKVEVQTPLSPTDWQLIFDGEAVTLFPSIGNWGLTCRSHYWISDNQITWAEQWTKGQIQRGREATLQQKERFYASDRGGNEESAEGVSSKISWFKKALFQR